MLQLNELLTEHDMSPVVTQPNMQDHIKIDGPLKLIRAKLTSAHMSEPYQL